VGPSSGTGTRNCVLVLFSKLGVKVGKGDLRDTSKAKLLEVALELKVLLEVGLELRVLKSELNGYNQRHFGAIVDEEGNIIEGGIRDAIRRGLVVSGFGFKFSH